MHKPPGIHVHPTSLSLGEVSLQEVITEVAGRKPFPVHRLDRPTSGVLLFTWDAPAAGVLGKLFQTRRVEKSYQALVRGWCPGFCSFKVLEDLDNGGNFQSARTEVVPKLWYEIPQPLGRYETTRISLVDLFPHTGRRHQLRRHLKSAFHPIIGDTRYSDGKYNDYFRKLWNHHRLFLLSRSLRFPHPVSGEILEVTTDWEPEVLELWKSIESNLVVKDF